MHGTVFKIDGNVVTVPCWLVMLQYLQQQEDQFFVFLLAPTQLIAILSFL